MIVLVTVVKAASNLSTLGLCSTGEIPGPEWRLISTEERNQHVQLSREDMHRDADGGTFLAIYC